MLDFSRCRLPPFAHQREDTQALLNHPFYFIASEMRTGKTKIVIDAAQFLFEQGVIDWVLVVAPAPVRAVWFDETLGEIAKHSWLPSAVTELHTKLRIWKIGNAIRMLSWYVTNFEYLTSEKNLDEAMLFCDERTLLVIDESSYVKSLKAQRTKACFALRALCGRVVLLNGTPIFHSPMDLLAQANLLHPSILDCKSATHFKARYAVMRPVMGAGGRLIMNKWNRPIQTVQSWVNLDDLQARLAPFTTRRMQAECLDLPPKLEAVALTATLDPATWKIYKEMRDDFCAWLKDGNIASSSTAAIKTLRLTQITSGILGGVEDMQQLLGGEDGPRRVDTIDVGREKIDIVLWFLEQRLEEDPNFKVVLWCKFRPELERLMATIATAFPALETASLWGGQKDAERKRAMELLNPMTAPSGPAALGVTFGTGGFGVNFTAARCSVNVSQDFSPGKNKQSADRIYGPGMIGPAAYFDVVAVGPKNQRTIDHHIVATRRVGQDVADWTAAAWIKALQEE